MPDEADPFGAVIAALDEAGILADIVLVGGWAQFLYRRYFNNPPELSALRTLDIDLLFTRPPKHASCGPLLETFAPLGFRKEISAEGFMKFVSREMEIDFLIPDRGKGDQVPYLIPDLAISAQSLRYMDMLLEDTIPVIYEGHRIMVPDPIRFCFHKLIVSDRRDSSTKREKDLTTGIEMASLLCSLPDWRTRFSPLLASLPQKSRTLVISILARSRNQMILSSLPIGHLEKNKRV